MGKREEGRKVDTHPPSIIPPYAPAKHSRQRQIMDDLKTILHNPINPIRDVTQRSVNVAMYKQLKPFTADPVKALHFAILV